MTWTPEEEDRALEVKIKVVRHRARYHAYQDLKARPGAVLTWDPAPTTYGHVHIVTHQEARQMNAAARQENRAARRDYRAATRRLWCLRLTRWWRGL